MKNFFRSLSNKPNTSIDDPIQVKTLIEKMKAHLPIRAHATKQLLPSLKISKPGVQIVEVINLGDEGGDFVPA